MEILFFKSISLNHPGGLKNIILKYSSLKRRQLREIDLTLSWKNGRSEDISQIDLRSISLRSIWDRYMESRWLAF